MNQLKAVVKQFLKNKLLNETEKTAIDNYELLTSKEFVSEQVELSKRDSDIKKFNAYTRFARRIIDNTTDVEGGLFACCSKENLLDKRTLALKNLKYSIGKLLQLELFTHAINTHSTGTWDYDFFSILPYKLEICDSQNCYSEILNPDLNRKSKFVKCVSLASDLVVDFNSVPFFSFPWNYHRMHENYTNLCNKEWIQDDNHHGNYFLHLDIGFFSNGFHSGMTGILFDSGRINLNYKTHSKYRMFSVYDISPLFGLIEINNNMEWVACDSMVRIPKTYSNKIKNISKSNTQIHNWHLAAIYSITQLMYQNDLI